MDEDFEIPVQYRGKEEQFTARLLPMGYVYKIEVEVHGTPVLFEPDEERAWRALVDPELPLVGKPPEPGLLQAIAASIEEILK